MKRILIFGLALGLGSCTEGSSSDGTALTDSGASTSTGGEGSTAAMTTANSPTTGSAETGNDSTAGAEGTPVDTDSTPDMTFFVTSRGHENGGNFGGLAGADSFCQELAEAAGVQGHNWRAYLSTEGPDGENARDRIGPGPWYNHAGDLVAENVEDLHARGISNGPTEEDPDRVQHILDENGQEVPPGGGGNGLHDIVTGSDENGEVVEGNTCNNWTATEGVTAWVGHSDVLNAERPSWNSEHPTASCIARTDDNREESIGSGGGDGRIYCFAAD